MTRCRLQVLENFDFAGSIEELELQSTIVDKGSLLKLSSAFLSF